MVPTNSGQSKSLSDPAPNFRFTVQWSTGGQTLAAFTECTGLTAQRKTEQVREGGLNDLVHTLPGRIEHTNIVLKHGVTTANDFWNWFMVGLHDCKIEKRDITITLIDAGTGSQGRQSIRVWWVRNAFPVKWTGPELRAGDSTAAIETLELAHHGIELK